MTKIIKKRVWTALYFCRDKSLTLKIQPREWPCSTDLSTIVMQPCTEVSNLTFRYPGQDTDMMAGWRDNLSTSWTLADLRTALDRTGWRATAFNEVNGTNPISNEGSGANSAIDGNSGTRWDSRGSQAPGQWWMVTMPTAATLGYAFGRLYASAEGVIEVYDLQGVRLMAVAATETGTDVSRLSRGVYVAVLRTSAGAVATLKIVR